MRKHADADCNRHWTADCDLSRNERANTNDSHIDQAADQNAGDNS